MRTQFVLLTLALLSAPAVAAESTYKAPCTYGSSAQQEIHRICDVKSYIDDESGDRFYYTIIFPKGKTHVMEGYVDNPEVFLDGKSSEADTEGQTVCAYRKGNRKGKAFADWVCVDRESVN